VYNDLLDAGHAGSYDGCATAAHFSIPLTAYMSELLEADTPSKHQTSRHSSHI